MNIFHRIFLTGAVVATSALAFIAQAQTMSGHDHHSAAPTAGPAVFKGGEMSDGEVRKVDMESRKITLKHGPLKNLDMPAMTMVFEVNDAAMLDKFKAGDKVRFKASNDGGKLSVTEMQPVK